ncbi:MAG: EAL domain-containing protein, partial [Gallionella sp.]
MMKAIRFVHVVRPYLAVIAVIATAAALVFTIYFTELGIHWTAFLSGVLVAATLAEASRVTHAEWMIKRRTAQLEVARRRLENETRLRELTEKLYAEVKPRLHLIDEMLPTMIAFVDIEGRCQYFNRAFSDLMKLHSDQSIGHHMREVLGGKMYQDLAKEFRIAQEGNPAHYEYSHKRDDGTLFRLSVEHYPQHGDDGKVSGFFMLVNDITSREDLNLHGSQVENSNAADARRARFQAKANDLGSPQELFVDSFSEQISGRNDAQVILTAINRNEFRLYSQIIVPLPIESAKVGHHEILVRLMEEEESMMPPGAFFPLAEKYGLMPKLDRWVVQHVAEHIFRLNSHGLQPGEKIYFVNVSGATLLDAGFPEFLRLTLTEHHVPGGALCFEFPGTEILANHAMVAEFSHNVRKLGCSIAISGFGRDQVL